MFDQQEPNPEELAAQATALAEKFDDLSGKLGKIGLHTISAEIGSIQGLPNLSAPSMFVSFNLGALAFSSKVQNPEGLGIDKGLELEIEKESLLNELKDIAKSMKDEDEGK